MTVTQAVIAGGTGSGVEPGRRREHTSAREASDLTFLGDGGTWVDLVRRHRSALVSTAVRTAGEANADDVVQEVLLFLLANPDRYDPSRGNVRSYLVTQAHSRAVDLVRAEQSRRRRDDADLDRRHALTDPAIDEEIANRLSAVALRDAVAALPVLERDCISAAYDGEVSYRQVARQLGLPEGTVKSRIRSGLRRLRDDPATIR